MLSATKPNNKLTINKDVGLGSPTALAAGGVAKATISEGGFSDIKGCYPRAITDNEKAGSVRMGAGLVTVIPVMGTALINAVALDTSMFLSFDHPSKYSY